MECVIFRGRLLGKNRAGLQFEGMESPYGLTI